MSNSIPKNSGLTNEPEVDKILRLLIEIGMEMLNADEGSLLLCDPAKKDLVFTMTAGCTDEKLIGQRLAFGIGITGMAAQTCELQIGSKDHMHVVPGDGEPHTVIAAPVMSDDELLGVMTLVSFNHERIFTVKDGDFYMKLAAVAGVVLEQQKRLASAFPSEIAPLVKSPEKLAILAGILRDMERLRAL